MFASGSMPQAGEHHRRPPAVAGCVVLIIALIATGCRLPATQGPVPRSLAASRELSQQGVSALDSGDWTKAEHLFNQAVDTCQSDANARRHYAETLWHRGQQTEAIAQLDEAIRLSPDDDMLLVRAAEMRLAAGDAPGAKHDVQSAIDINPRSPSAWMLAGRIEVAGGHSRDALAAFHKALSLAPESRETLLELAECYRRLGEPERALVNLQTLADTYPPGEEPRQVAYLEGMALSALGRQQDAVDALTQAAAHGAPDAEILCSLATAEARAGLADDAWRDVQRALNVNSQHPASRRLAAQLGLARQGTGRMTR